MLKMINGHDMRLEWKGKEWEVLLVAEEKKKGKKKQRRKSIFRVSLWFP